MAAYPEAVNSIQYWNDNSGMIFEAKMAEVKAILVILVGMIQAPTRKFIKFSKKKTGLVSCKTFIFFNQLFVKSGFTVPLGY